jgi:hypothetical protein
MSVKGESAASAADLMKETDVVVAPPETEKSVELPAGLQFVCFPCKRGFFSDEQMLAHEQKSLNHRAILERFNIQQIKEEITSKASKAAMRDEVKKYRQALEEQRVVREDKIVRAAGPADTLGSDNVGNKLLQKMGWSEGKGITMFWFRVCTRSSSCRPWERRNRIQGSHKCRHERRACWLRKWDGMLPFILLWTCILTCFYRM